MAQQTINVGAAPNDGTGTPLRTAFQYTNSNFTELYTALGGGSGLPGASGQLIFNNGTSLAGDNELFYNATTNTLTTEKLIVPGNTQVAGSLSNLYVGSILNPTLFVNTNTNRVGIGTATPGTACDVASGTVRVKNAVGDTSGLLIYQDTGDASKIFNYYNGSMQFGINNTTAMTLNATGLGVGDAPAANTRLTLGSVNPTGLNLAFKTTGVTTGRVQTYLGNTSGDLLSGIEGSTAGQTLTGSAAYSGFIGTITNNPFYLVSNGLIRATIDSSGNVGIGVAPSAWGSGFRYVQAGPGCAYGTNGSVDRTDVAANWYYNGGDKYINATGKASIFQQSGGAFFWLSTNTASGGAGSAMTLNTNMTLDASGNLLVGTTTTSGNAGGLKLSNVGGTLGQITFSNNSGVADYVARFNYGSTPTLVGTITVASGGTTYNTTSDYRLKESVKPLVGGLARVSALKPSIYKWKSDGSSGEGFLAHELAEVVPFAVTGEKDAVNEDGSVKAQGVDLSRVVPILVAAIQELAAEVNALKNA